MLRDYSSISPSAKSLLLTKALTTIPFMADAAKLIYGNEAFESFASGDFDETFLKQLLHFEDRYLSLDSLFFASGSLNILEISSGYSFRGLDIALKHPNIFYLDTDLPEIINTKLDLINRLIKDEQLLLRGNLQTTALNALDEVHFMKSIDQMPAGSVSIINEGLLMYLDIEEKAKLCSTIHRALKKRGGYWITADVYIKKAFYKSTQPNAFNKFLEAHHVEENKFDSFEQAEHFFNEQGFKLVKKATSVWHQLSSVKYIDPVLLKKWIAQAERVGRIRETWALKAI